jgi:hypothetical protein
MKKTICFFSIIIFILIFIPAAYGQMGSGSRSWKLYDDFSSGLIDATKWAIDNSSATITVENGMAKFVHLAGHPNDSSWLSIIQNPHKITGIKATVIFDSCQTPLKDVRARLGSYVGTDQGDPDTLFFSELAIEPYYKRNNYPRIYGAFELLDIPNSFDYLSSLFWGSFYFNDGTLLPTDVMGVPYTLIMEWTTKDVSYTLQREVEGLGVINYTWDKSLVLEKIPDAESALVGIGTRSTQGDGQCTIYFDNVYIKQSRQR